MEISRVFLIISLVVAGCNAPTPDNASSKTLAAFEDRDIDLTSDWGDANACYIWEQKGMVECFRTIEEMEARLELIRGFAVLAGAVGPSPLHAVSSCGGALQLYRYANFQGRTLYFFDRQIWQDLDRWGFSNMTSSFRIGSCDARLSDGKGGRGTLYPTYRTRDFDSAAHMLSGWDNRVSSIYIE